MTMKYHNYHMTPISPWPIMSSLITLSSLSNMTTKLYSKMNKLNLMMMAILMTSAFKWWSDTFKESSKQGEHPTLVMKGLKMGMVLFIISEVLFFASFFWAYFHSSISPNMETGQKWPPLSIMSFSPTSIPLLNTIILISSGASITWSHHSIITKNMKKAKMSLLMTWTLGLYFSALQMMEYKQSQFSWQDSSYSSTFFLATGFHGIHVLIGTCFLLFNMMLMKNSQMNSTHHIGFEMAAWYWHFVDVVWLFLYISIYWWGE